MILKTKDLIEKSEKDLNEQLADLRKELFTTKMAFHARKLENTSTLKQLKRSIARIQTILTQKSNKETRN
ncbi:MAG: Ribosomal protein [Cyanobacteriota bacterium]|jgi:large subunit ribosomal protein L29